MRVACLVNRIVQQVPVTANRVSYIVNSITYSIDCITVLWPFGTTLLLTRSRSTNGTSRANRVETVKKSRDT